MKNLKAILQVPGTMKIISAEIPVPKEDEVLIKVEYVGICGSDVHGFESNLAFLAVTVVTVWKANITSARTLILWRHNPTTAAH